MHSQKQHGGGNCTPTEGCGKREVGGRYGGQRRKIGR